MTKDTTRQAVKQATGKTALEQKTTKADIIKNLPECFKAIAQKQFVFNNSLIYIAVRVKPSQKPPLYLLNLNTKSYISALFYNEATGHFIFDLKNKETAQTEMYELIYQNNTFKVESLIKAA